MPRVRPSEIKALVPLLMWDHESPEALAEALIVALDQERASRTSYVAVMQFGAGGVTDDYGYKTRHPFYVGLGPYPGKASARKAALQHPSAGMSSKIVVIPLTSPAGLELLLKEVG